MIKQSSKAIKIRIMSYKSSLVIFHTVYCPYSFCLVRYFIQIWYYRFLIRYGHIDRFKILSGQKNIQFIFIELYKLILIIT